MQFFCTIAAHNFPGFYRCCIRINQSCHQYIVLCLNIGNLRTKKRWQEDAGEQEIAATRCVWLARQKFYASLLLSPSLFSDCFVKKILQEREGWLYQIGWIFRKTPNGLRPPPSFTENYIANFLSSLLAESARAVIGRRCPHSGVGEDFLAHRPGAFEKTTVTQKRKVENKKVPFSQMNNANKVHRRFFRYVGPKLLLSPGKLGFLAQKTAKFGLKYAFLVKLGQKLAFLAHLVPCLTNKQCEQGA